MGCFVGLLLAEPYVLGGLLLIAFFWAAVSSGRH